MLINLGLTSPLPLGSSFAEGSCGGSSGGGGGGGFKIRSNLSTTWLMLILISGSAISMDHIKLFISDESLSESLGSKDSVSLSKAFP